MYINIIQVFVNENNCDSYLHVPIFLLLSFLYMIEQILHILILRTNVRFTRKNDILKLCLYYLEDSFIDM